MATSMLVDLERAELESRARRLEAEAEADRRIAAAAASAGSIRATLDGEVAAALAALRARYEEAADAEIAATEAERARLDRDRSSPHAIPGFGESVAAIVEAVLGEGEA
jgi:hypothetical protein